MVVGSLDRTAMRSSGWSATARRARARPPDELVDDGALPGASVARHHDDLRRGGCRRVEDLEELLLDALRERNASDAVLSEGKHPRDLERVPLEGLARPSADVRVEAPLGALLQEEAADVRGNLRQGERGAIDLGDAGLQIGRAHV